MKTIEEIENYIEEQDQNGALLVTGKWGSGKTYLIRQIEKKLNQEPKNLMAVVSLFGIEDTNTLSKKVKEAVAYAKELDVKLVPYENEHGMAGTKAAMEQIKKGESIAVFIGPEGGFAPEEIALVKDEMQLISLGKRILRTETTGIAALAILGYQLESSDMIE